MAHDVAVLVEPTDQVCPTAVPEHQLVGWRFNGYWLVLGRVGMDLFAFREICPGCGSSLVRSPLAAGVVSCSICRHRYDLTRGGCSLEPGVRGLEPAPVLGEHAEMTA